MTQPCKLTKWLEFLGFLQIVLALLLGVVLFLTFRNVMAAPGDLRLGLSGALTSADRSLAAAQTVLESNQAAIVEMQAALQETSRLGTVMAESTAQTAPLLQAWGEDVRSLGATMHRLGQAVAALPFCGPVGSEIQEHGSRLHATGDTVRVLAQSLREDGVSALRRTSTVTAKLGDGQISSATQDMVESLAAAREAVRESMAMVTPAVTLIRLMLAVYAAGLLVLLLCGITTCLVARLLGRSQAAFSVPGSE